MRGLHPQSLALLLLVTLLLLSLLSPALHAQPADSDDDELTVSDDDTPASPPAEAAEDQPIVPEMTPLISEDPAVPAFLDYLREHGVDRSAVELFDGFRGRGLRATRALPVNSTFLSVPTSLLITTNVVRKDKKLAALLEDLETIDAFALWLAHYRRDNDTKFAPYLRTLPRFVPLPLFYAPAISKEYKGTQLEDVADNRRGVAYSTWHRLDDKLKQLTSKQDYLWALSILWSRSCSFAVKDGDKWRNIAALAPMVDMVNTGNATELNARCRTSRDGKFFTCSTIRSVNPSEELLVTYGPRSNAALLHDYGFSLPSNNPHDFVSIDLPSAKHNKTKGDSHRTGMRKIEVEDELMRLIGQRDHSLKFKLPRPHNFSSLSHVLPADIIGWARLNVIKGFETANLTAYEMIERIKTGEPFSAPNTLAAVKLVNKHVRKAIRRYPTAIDDDYKQLTERALYNENLPVYWIIMVRYSEKSILHDVSNFLTQLIPMLEQEAEEEIQARKAWKAQRDKDKQEKEERERQRKLEKERQRREEDAREAARRHVLEEDEAEEEAPKHDVHRMGTIGKRDDLRRI